MDLVDIDGEFVLYPLDLGAINSQSKLNESYARTVKS